MKIQLFLVAYDEECKRWALYDECHRWVGNFATEEDANSFAEFMEGRRIEFLREFYPEYLGELGYGL